MIRYLLKRFFFFLPTLFAVSLLAFTLGKLAPGDPILIYNEGFMEESFFTSPAEEDRIYFETAKILGLDKPPFYFSIHSLAYPDTLYKVLHPLKRENLSNLTRQFGNWPLVEHYFLKIKQLDQRFSNLPDNLANNASKRFRNVFRDLYLNSNPQVVRNKFKILHEIREENLGLRSYLSPTFQELDEAYQTMTNETQHWKLFIPSFSWHGVDNQYHNWVINFIKGDFGRSYIDGRSVAQKITIPLKWTLLMNFFAILIAFSISIFLGRFIAIRKGQLIDRVVTFVLFLFYSLPTFWIGTLLIIFFTNPEYGMDWFPTLGLHSLPDDAPFLDRIWDIAYHLVLPVFCLTYGAFAFITRQMRNSTSEELNKPYILSARARGLSLREATRKHAFRNALFPIITLVASIFPALLTGSFVIELIFNIPGMGLTTIHAIRNSDWPVVYAILMLSSVFTIIGILIADILYKWFNPRVEFN